METYKDAKGVLPWKEGDGKPEDTIRRLRGGVVMDKKPNLKPCPFCGSKKTTLRPNGVGYYVGCLNCNVGLSCVSDPEELWNRRVEEDRLRGLCSEAAREMNSFGNLINWPDETPMSYAEMINKLREAASEDESE